MCQPIAVSFVTPYWFVHRLIENVLFTAQLIDTVLTGERQFPAPIQTGNSDTPPTGSAELIESIKRDWPRMSSVSDSHLITITSTVSSLHRFNVLLGSGPDANKEVKYSQKS